MLQESAVERVKATAVDAKTLATARTEEERERAARAMVERAEVRTCRGGWSTGIEGWRQNKKSLQAPANPALKEKYLTTLAHARSHIGLPCARPGCHRRQEMYAYPVCIVMEYVRKTERYEQLPYHSQEERQSILNNLAGMYQTLSELLFDLGKHGEILGVVALPDAAMLGMRSVSRAEAFNLGGEAASRALEMRRPGGKAANAEAMGACLFWYAINMLASGDDEATMLTVLQDAYEKFNQLSLPPNHFRKVQIRIVLAELEGNLRVAVPCSMEEQSQQEQRQRAALECVVCVAQPRAVAFQCGHFATCAGCSESLSTCPICRAVVLERRSIYTP